MLTGITQGMQNFSNSLENRPDEAAYGLGWLIRAGSIGHLYPAPHAVPFIQAQRSNREIVSAATWRRGLASWLAVCRQSR